MTLTIQQAIDSIIGAVPGAPFAKTVDKVTLGDTSQPIRGIVTTFLATHEIIEQVAKSSANLIISHETVFYNHIDEIDWLYHNAVYQNKRRLIEDNCLVIWRFHDYLHALPPDMTVVGMLRELAWEPNCRTEMLPFCPIPPMPLQDLVTYIKTKLGLEHIRVIGDLTMMCRGVAVLPGFAGKERQIHSLSQPEVDVVICGEAHEWEATEYVRDAVHMGHQKALIVLGHAASEEPGMKWIIPWLQTRVPGVPISFVPTGNLFHWF